jgi:hypothetical protein
MPAPTDQAKNSKQAIASGQDTGQCSEVAARLVAFYLPQFHPIPENDAWWGKGFTEWTNVTRAKPLFSGHFQPRQPGQLGFYDLSNAETRAAQAEMARSHGIEGFCYWHYWFEGSRLLERPFDEVLTSGEPNFPFCLAWANHDWSRAWMGDTKDVLVKQSYSSQDDQRHARWLVRAFSDRRYLRIGDRPIFVIYQPHSLPNPQVTTGTFRNECVRQGLPEPYLVGINNAGSAADARTLGFDETLIHQPYLWALPGAGDGGSRARRFLRCLRHRLPRNLRHRTFSPCLKVYDYSEALRLMAEREVNYPHIPCLFVGWDNTARRGRDAIIVLNATPEKFEAALRDVVKLVSHKPFEQRLVFLNAWNEWAEGMYLEPDQRWGASFLEAVRRVNVCCT